MTNICIIRHGETDWNVERRCQGWEDTDLNENGRKQAAEVVKELKKMNWDVIISSPILRAQTTAKIIGKAININDITINRNFMERNYGKASGLTVDQIKETFPDNLIPDIESNETLGARVIKGLTDEVKKHEGKNILIVSHGGAIATLLNVLSDGEIVTGLKNACINLIRYENDTYTIDLYNATELKLINSSEIH